MEQYATHPKQPHGALSRALRRRGWPVGLFMVCLAGSGCSLEVVESGDEVAVTRQAIRNGTPSDDPSVVFLAANEGIAPEGCSGTLLAKNVVLTAKHCLPATPRQLQVQGVGARSGLAPEDLLAVGCKFFPRDSADLAVVRLDRDVAGGTIRRALGRTFRASDEGALFRFVGYGPTTIDGRGAGEQRAGDLAFSESGLLDSLRVTFGDFSGDPGAFQKFLTVDDVSACKGDSGGPAIDPATGNVVAVTSQVRRPLLSDGVCDVLETRAVDLRPYQNWIDQRLQRALGTSCDPPAVLTLAPANVTLARGGAVTFTLGLSQVAPPGGIAAKLATNPPLPGQLPSAVRIEEGTRSVRFEFSDKSGTSTTITAAVLQEESLTAVPARATVTIEDLPVPTPNEVLSMSYCSNQGAALCAVNGCYCEKGFLGEEACVSGGGGSCAFPAARVGCPPEQLAACFSLGCGCNQGSCRRGNCPRDPFIGYSPTRSPTPILIDAAGDGFDLTGPGDGVAFDIRADGSLARVSWTTPGDDDSWLVLDRDGNGRIDDGSELFGDATEQSESVAPNGFLALAELDRLEQGGNENGIVDDGDALFSQLRLWRDADHDAETAEGELRPLGSVGIKALGLRYRRSLRRDRHGNEFRYRAFVYRSRGGEAGWLTYDVYLKEAAN